MFFPRPPKRSLDLGSGGFFMVTTKSSFLLAVLLIANPFMLLLFQNCSSNPQDRVIASNENTSPVKNLEESEPVFQAGKNLKIK